MNCIDFRRDALAHPLGLRDDCLTHAQECPACRAFLERTRELDAQLFDALNVPAPDGLADRILVAHGIRRRGTPWLWGLAAVLVMAVALGIVARPTLEGRSLASEAIAHVQEEPQAFTLVSRHDPELLARDLGSQGIRLARSLGEVTFTMLCPLSAGKANHIVVATPAGPVTLLLLPTDATRRSRAVIEADGVTAIALPAARGSIAIVAATREQALAVERSLILA
jgi:hypothetical protein